MKCSKAYRARFLTLAVSCSLMIGACNPAETANVDLDGRWYAEDYGLIIDNAGDRIRMIEQTPVSCLVTEDEPIETLKNSLIGRPDPKKKTIITGSSATLSTKTFRHLDEEAFDLLCPNGLTDKTSDPELNFEVLWQTFHQHYAFFAEREIDWEANYAKARPKITKDMSEDDLGETLGAMLNQLEDAHVSLYIDDDDLVSVDTNFEARLREACQQEQGTACNTHDFGDEVEDRYRSFKKVIETSYLDDEFETGLGGYALWGEIDERTGYFRIDAMEGLAEEHYSADADLAALEEALDQMLEDIGHLPTMIVDVRLNGGGHDTVAVKIAGRFADKRRLFGSKRAFAGEGTTTDLVVEPAKGRRFAGPIAVLTSGETASAAEIFVMAMRALPNVTLIGTPTQGILSDELYRTLPNDWMFSLSNEIYLTHDGLLFEGIGVPPNIEAPFLGMDDLEHSVDPGIDAALTLLTEQAAVGPKNH